MTSKNYDSTLNQSDNEWNRVRNLPPEEKAAHRAFRQRARDARRQARRKEMQDGDYATTGRVDRGARMDIGLRFMSGFAAYLKQQTGYAPAFERDEIAAFAGCTEESIRVIEKRALEKLRKRFPEAREMLRRCDAAGT